MITKYRRTGYYTRAATRAARTIQGAYRRYGGRINSAIGAANAMNAYRSFTNTMTRNRTTSGQGVTSQYDRKLIYRKKRMPRFKKKLWRKFKNKVTAVSTKTLGSNTVVRNNLIQFDFGLTPTNLTKQLVFQLALYPMQNTGGVDYLNDLSSICTNDSRVKNSTKLIFMSGILDLTIRPQTLRGTENVNPTLSAEIDIYEMSMSGATGITNEASSLLDAFVKADTDTDKIPGSAVSLTLDSRGATPWDLPEALSQHRIKIWKKTKYFLSSEQTMTYQVRDPKTHIFTQDQLPSGTTSVTKPGMTKYLLIIAKPIPGYSYPGAGNNDILRVNVGVTRKYLYKINDQSADYDAYGN